MNLAIKIMSLVFLILGSLALLPFVLQSFAEIKLLYLLGFFDKEKSEKKETPRKSNCR